MERAFLPRPVVTGQGAMVKLKEGRFRWDRRKTFFATSGETREEMA